MLMQRLIIFVLLVYLIDGGPIDQIFKKYAVRRQLRFTLDTWQTAEVLSKRLPINNDPPNELDNRLKRGEARPVEGPMNIEQLPAMLAARNVKRYPYSQKIDPAIIG